MSDLLDEIKAANKVWMMAFKAQNPDAIGELYTEDCKTMPTGSKVVEGRKDTSDVFRGAMAMGVATVALGTDEVGPMGAGDTAFERGHYTFFKADGSDFDVGKYVIVWKKVEGKWYLYIDIWNSNKM